MVNFNYTHEALIDDFIDIATEAQKECLTTRDEIMCKVALIKGLINAPLRTYNNCYETVRLREWQEALYPVLEELKRHYFLPANYPKEQRKRYEEGY